MVNEYMYVNKLVKMNKLDTKSNKSYLSGIFNPMNILLSVGLMFGSSSYSQSDTINQINNPKEISTSSSPMNYSDKYAVLISGNVERRNLLDLTLFYQVCLEEGFDKKNIYILDGDAVETPYYPVDAISSKESIDSLFHSLSEEIDSNDLLFVYITDHGRRSTYNLGTKTDPEFVPVSEIKLHGSFLNDIELKGMLDRIDSKNTIVFTNICYGGGFAKRFSEGKYVGISSSLENTLAHGNERHTFGRYFMSSFRNISESDSNKDGFVSIRESFNYAKKKHSSLDDECSKDIPLLKSELNLDSLSLR